MKNRSLYLTILAAIVIAAIILMALQPPIAQPSDYHNFADQREFFGVPNFWNVISNLPFLLFGILGLIAVVKNKYSGGLPELRVAYACFFVLVMSVCIGSSYYHWSPSNETLAWDRLPIALAFMVFVAIVVGEHINVRVGPKLLVPLLALGAFSVWYWRYTESLGRGDLRLYLLVQFLPLLLLPLVLWMFPSRLSGVKYLWWMFAGYAIAKVFEELDTQIYSTGHLISGHSLKHIVAALALGVFLLALHRRVVIKGIA